MTDPEHGARCRTLSPVRRGRFPSIIGLIHQFPSPALLSLSLSRILLLVDRVRADVSLFENSVISDIFLGGLGGLF